MSPEEVEYFLEKIRDIDDEYMSGQIQAEEASVKIKEIVSKLP